MTRIIQIFLFIFATCVFVQAQKGIYIEQKSSTEGMMGRPAQTEIAKLWLLEDRMRIESDEAITIFRNDQGKVYMIMPKDKKYFELSMAEIKQLTQMGMGMLQQNQDQSFEFKKTGRTRKIHNWDCYEVTAKNSLMTETIWMTEDLPYDKEQFYKYFKNTPEMQPYIEDFYRNEEIEGFPVLTETEVNMMGNVIKSNSELIKISEQDIPADMFEVPDGLTKIDNPMGGMMPQNE